MPSNTGQFSTLTCHILTPVSGSLSPRATCSSQRCVTVDASCCCVSQSIRPVSAVRGNVNEQIATALLRLQHDMAAVLDRLHALEALTLSQVKDQLHYVACGDRDDVITFCYRTKCWFIFPLFLHFFRHIYWNCNSGLHTTDFSYSYWSISILLHFSVKIVFAKTGWLPSSNTKGPCKNIFQGLLNLHFKCSIFCFLLLQCHDQVVSNQKTNCSKQVSVFIVPETFLVAFWLLSTNSGADCTLASDCSLAGPGLLTAEEKVSKILI